MFCFKIASLSFATAYTIPPALFESIWHLGPVAQIARIRAFARAESRAGASELRCRVVSPLFLTHGSFPTGCSLAAFTPLTCLLDLVNIGREKYTNVVAAGGDLSSLKPD